MRDYIYIRTRQYLRSIETYLNLYKLILPLKIIITIKIIIITLIAVKVVVEPNDIKCLNNQIFA